MIVSDEPNKLAEELAAEAATNGDVDVGPLASAQSGGPERRCETAAGRAADRFAEDDSDVEMSSVEEPIAEEAAAYEEAAEVIEDEAAGDEEVETEDTAEPETEQVARSTWLRRRMMTIHMDWYILKVQSNRERSIAEALAAENRRSKGLDKYFDQMIVPTEKVTEFKGGKKKVVERKLYPGYIVVHMHINDDTWFAVRETSGVGDFTGAGGKPTPMLASEVSRIVQTETEETDRSAEAGYQVFGRRQGEGQGRQFRELRGRSRHDRRSQRPRDGDDQHLRPQHAGGIGILANRSDVRRSY